MVKDSEAHAEEDKKKREEVNTRNQLDSMIYTTEKTLTENKDKIPADKTTELEAALASGKKALETNDVDAMKKEIENLHPFLTRWRKKCTKPKVELLMQVHTDGAANMGAEGGPVPPKK
jgi:molecular chaperone DnaK (HSP70)